MHKEAALCSHLAARFSYSNSIFGRRAEIEFTRFSFEQVFNFPLLKLWDYEIIFFLAAPYSEFNDYIVLHLFHIIIPIFCCCCYLKIGDAIRYEKKSCGYSLMVLHYDSKRFLFKGCVFVLLIKGDHHYLLGSLRIEIEGQEGGAVKKVHMPRRGESADICYTGKIQFSDVVCVCN